eukprot:TRINITY_DN1208_c0_g1_i1.p2 TRINITY_DN1208_c0_g1~~TRINITY_DN1208_c0_g1_i1.p2  ORF type:complete len:168 (-),score=21.36 TRINITY_DN1208_c0_g1_i1:315-818(-)
MGIGCCNKSMKLGHRSYGVINAFKHSEDHELCMQKYKEALSDKIKTKSQLQKKCQEIQKQFSMLRQLIDKSDKAHRLLTKNIKITSPFETLITKIEEFIEDSKIVERVRRSLIEAKELQEQYERFKRLMQLYKQKMEALERAIKCDLEIVKEMSSQMEKFEGSGRKI